MLDCFSSYHQIFMKKSDEEKTTFTTPFSTYCYVRMPEGLRNAGCTFNRTIAAVLDTQLERNISAYVDDVVVRSKNRERPHLRSSRKLHQPSQTWTQIEPRKVCFQHQKG